MTEKFFIFCNRSTLIGSATYKMLEVAQEILGITTDDIVEETIDLRRRLASGEYGLVIDTTTLGKPETERGAVDVYLNQMILDQIPEVIQIRNPLTAFADTKKSIENYLK